MINEMGFQVGQRVRLLKDIWDDGQDHHPPGYIAHKGEVLIVRRADGRGTFPVAVSHENVTDRSFGVALDEITPADPPRCARSS